MKTQLYFDLAGKTDHPRIHFRESKEVEEIMEDLRTENIAVFEIDGAALSSQEDLFKAFAIVLRKPKGWYGDEEYPNNVNAFLEYLDDVLDWVPAKGHVALVRGSEQLWRDHARLAGELTEWWQFATVTNQATVHLVFVW
jgi:hypothetical protein